GHSGMDILISSAYKWMLAGFGNGFAFFNENAFPYLYADGKYIKPSEPFLQGKSRLSLYFEPGHLDTLAFGSLRQSLMFFHEIGVDVIEDRIRTIADMAKEAFAERGLLQKEVINRKEHSSIFNLTGDDALFHKLLAEKIICVQWGKGIRVGFHFFNTQDDLNKILAVIDGHFSRP